MLLRLKTYKAEGAINPTPYAPTVDVKDAPDFNAESDGFDDDAPEDVGPHYYKIDSYDCLAIVRVVMEGGKWRESLVKAIKGNPRDLRIGGAEYMSYLTPQEILSWMNKDYGNATYLGTEYP